MRRARFAMIDFERQRICWVVTDGRAGNLAPAMGLAKAIARRTALEIVTKRIEVGAPWRYLPRALWGDALARNSGDRLGAPFPDLLIGCGRQSVPISIAVKRQSPATFTVQLQTPRAPLGHFDLVVAPSHDRTAGANVISMIGSPTAIVAAPRRPAGAVSSVAVLIGGPNSAFRMSRRDAAALAEQLSALAASGVRLSITTSRRTPTAVADILSDRLRGAVADFWRAGAEDAATNPYPAMLTVADAILVTEDSVNMAAEAAATGRPVFVIRLRRKPLASSRKFDDFHRSLRAAGASKYFDGELFNWDYPPFDETGRAAEIIVQRWR